VAISNVAPIPNEVLIEMCEKIFNLSPFFVHPGIKTGLKIPSYSLNELGSDRIVNAVAAYENYKKGVIILDLGTATTIDVVSQDGEFQGGIICPGIVTVAESLSQRIPKLPHVEITKPTHIVGTNTVACIQSGLYFGYIGMIDSLVERMQKETGKNHHVIATGGLAGLIAKDSTTIAETDEFLTLTGLKVLYELNL
jgi:type III pantothenate kinase